MRTQEIDRTVRRSRRNTIGDAVRRSSARNPEKEALIFGGRRWSYAELDAGANRVANALLAQGLEKGDRVAAYGMNSDAYVLLWLGCVRAGLIHVPVNFHLAGDELLYILNQSGSKAIFYDPQFEANVEEGYLYVVDRVKDVINTGGIQVSGSEVEEVLFGHEAVSEVAVIGLPDEKWIEAVSAVVVPKEDAETQNLREELQEHARAKLADFKLPKHIFFVDDLPRNAAGKILKRELREEFGAEN